MQGGARGLAGKSGFLFARRARWGGNKKSGGEGDKGRIISEGQRGKQKSREGRSGKGGNERIKAWGKKEGRREKRGNGEA